MRYTGLLLSLLSCVSLWECFDGGSTTLPHVQHYEVVRPQKLNGRRKRSISSQQKYPEKLEYALVIEGKNYTVHLEKNRDLIGKNFTLTYYTDYGAQVTESPDFQDHCYYHGQVHNVDDSAVSLGLCSGMRGFVRTEQQVYLIEPLEELVDGDHAVYRQEYLSKRGEGSEYINDTVYDFEPRVAGLYKPNSMKHTASLEKQLFVEMVLVVDNSEYKKIGSRSKVQRRMMEIANHVDKLYRPLNIRVMLVGLEIWSYRDQIEVNSQPNITLDNFLVWREKSLLAMKKHDNAQLVTAVDFRGSTVGLAPMYAMCSSRSGAVNEDHNDNPIGVASTIAHEMGHNLGMSHDSDTFVCPPTTACRGCIMGESVGFVYPKSFSSCSYASLRSFLETYDGSCMEDMPSTDHLYGGPLCGNAFVEKGEECDCGTVEECTNPCCNATTCRLTEGSQCAEGECCHNCQLRPSGSPCRASTDDCDLAEHCTGTSDRCPADSYKMNGQPCNSQQGYCYNGQCPSHTEHCKRLWGPGADVDADVCFYQNTKAQYGQRTIQDMKCGRIFCKGGNEFPITGRKTEIFLSNRICNVAVDRSGSEDRGLVPTGTKCGTNKVCYNSRCQDVKIFGTENCSAKCNNRGVCNHLKQCHCQPGWAPPYCDVKLSDLAKGSNAAVVGVSSAVAILILLVLVIGGSVCCKRRSDSLPTKRSFREACMTSGQSNPGFQAGSAKNSPRCGPLRIISQPTLVESSATQACQSLYVTVVPSRPPPAPPNVSAPGRPLLRPEQATEFVCRNGGLKNLIVKPTAPPPVVPSKADLSQTERLLPASKPLPPSRPLPVLSSKPQQVNKPKPPVPPIKPSGLQSPWNQPQVIVGQRVALKPPAKPR